MPRSKKSKHWCITINNPTEKDCPDLKEFDYIILGKEVGKDGTKHLQGYCVFKKRKHLSGAKKIFPRAHLEIKEGTIEQAVTYCQKDGNYNEWGTKPISSSEGMTIKNKIRWEEAFNAAKDGRINDIPIDMRMRYYHAWKRVEQDNPVKPNDLDSHHNYWIVGETGVGKSYYARKRFPDYFDKAPNKWFIGYKGESTILIDDLEPIQCGYLSWYIKRWADLYSFPMETKGGGHQIRPPNIVITSQYSIEECFPDVKKCNAVQRRFKVVNMQHWKKRINFKI